MIGEIKNNQTNIWMDVSEIEKEIYQREREIMICWQNLDKIDENLRKYCEARDTERNKIERLQNELMMLKSNAGQDNVISFNRADAKKCNIIIGG